MNATTVLPKLNEIVGCQSAVRQTRILQLDGLRGIAVLAVVLYHYVLSIPLPAGGFWLHLQDCFRLGWCGVDLLFVLSGFLIGGILLDARDSPRYFRTFYSRRFFRIFPLYYALACSLSGIGVRRVPPFAGVNRGRMAGMAANYRVCTVFAKPGCQRVAGNLRAVAWTAVVAGRRRAVLSDNAFGCAFSAQAPTCAVAGSDHSSGADSTRVCLFGGLPLIQANMLPLPAALMRWPWAFCWRSCYGTKTEKPGSRGIAIGFTPPLQFCSAVFFISAAGRRHRRGTLKLSGDFPAATHFLPCSCSLPLCGRRERGQVFAGGWFCGTLGQFHFAFISSIWQFLEFARQSLILFTKCLRELVMWQAYWSPRLRHGC
jgi:hypothetical protein